MKSKPLHRLLKGISADTTPWTGVWSLPDAAWRLITNKNPELRYYPMGDTAERAVKKRVLDLLPRSDPTGPPDLISIADEKLTQELLKAPLKWLGKQLRLEQFLANYFFEVAIDYLRRPSLDPTQDSAYEYHVSGANHAIGVKT